MLLVGDNQGIDGLLALLPFLSPEEKRQLAASVSCYRHRKGELIFSEGETPTGLVYLMSGKVKVFKRGVAGKEQTVRLVRPWEPVGVRALCAGEAYSATASALEASATCVVSRACTEALRGSNAAFAAYLTRCLARLMGQANARLTALMQKYVRARLADSLMLLADTYGLEADQTLCPCLSREEIAKLSHMTTANVIRTLSAFQGEGLVQLLPGN
ncbi:MAG: Crp/Fnr family transcriptional regulator, partial [Prevotellaceae bacterium]|nr:Crp/Fnr family transcriptional regulator [Prevotellaceae bacterium]